MPLSYSSIGGQTTQQIHSLTDESIAVDYIYILYTGGGFLLLFFYLVSLLLTDWNTMSVFSGRRLLCGQT